MFDYEDFNENELSSDIRFAKLFPNDLERWVTCRDLETEELLLDDYLDWAHDMNQCVEDSAGRDFYAGLVNEVSENHAKATSERLEALSDASRLGQWEWGNLDQDGGTTGIQAWSRHEWHNKMDCREVWIKYRHLASPCFEPQAFWSAETSSYTKFDGTPCDFYGKAILHRYLPIRLVKQDQQSTTSSDDDDNPHSATNSSSPFPDPIATDKRHDDHQAAEEHQPSPSLTPPSPIQEDSINNHDTSLEHSQM